MPTSGRSEIYEAGSSHSSIAAQLRAQTAVKGLEVRAGAEVPAEVELERSELVELLDRATLRRVPAWPESGFPFRCPTE